MTLVVVYTFNISNEDAPKLMFLIHPHFSFYGDDSYCTLITMCLKFDGLLASDAHELYCEYESRESRNLSGRTSAVTQFLWDIELEL